MNYMKDCEVGVIYDRIIPKRVIRPVIQKSHEDYIVYEIETQKPNHRIGKLPEKNIEEEKISMSTKENLIESSSESSETESESDEDDSDSEELNTAEAYFGKLVKIHFENEINLNRKIPTYYTRLENQSTQQQQPHTFKITTNPRKY